MENRNVKTAIIFSKLIYGALAIVFLLGGTMLLFNPSTMTPEASTPITEGVEYILKLKADFGHVTQEFGTTLIGIGIILTWAIFNFEQLKQINYCFLLFFLIFAGIHWAEYVQGNRSFSSPLINSLPVLLFLILIFFRNRVVDIK